MIQKTLLCEYKKNQFDAAILVKKGKIQCKKPHQLDVKNKLSSLVWKIEQCKT